MNPPSKPLSRRRLVLLGTACWATVGSALVSTPRAQAQPRWPSRPLKIIVAFPPGGLTDAYARLLGEQITAALGQPVIVENKPGAGAIIGIDAVVKSPADDGQMNCR